MFERGGVRESAGESARKSASHSTKTTPPAGIDADQLTGPEWKGINDGKKKKEAESKGTGIVRDAS